MGQYSIKELERLSGIKAHTIRIWEKRYNLLSPDRTDTNIRYYSDSDLKKLLNISFLNRHGEKISKMAALSEPELFSRVEHLASEVEDEHNNLEQLTVCMIEMDEVGFERLLSNFILKFGFEKTINEIVFPFLKKVGILWLSDNINPIQEHFISNLVRQKIIVAIDSLPVVSTPDAKKVMLFLPENELHEISLLYFHYIIRKSGFHTFYLGQHVPIDNLIESAELYKPDFLLSNFSYSPAYDKLDDYIRSLASRFPDCQILLTGYPVRVYEGPIPENVQIFADASDLVALF